MTDSTPSSPLTRAQRALLTEAAERIGGACDPSSRTGRRMAEPSLRRLIEQRLLREVRARPDMPVWREDEAGQPRALLITKKGRIAIQAVDALEATKGGAPEETHVIDRPANIVRTPRAGSKLAGVLMLLSREEGASASELIEATGWLPHTTRAALTGLRGRGHAVTRSREKARGTVYRVMRHPDQAEAA